jgi:hypothetical protein
MLSRNSFGVRSFSVVTDLKQQTSRNNKGTTKQKQVTDNEFESISKRARELVECVRRVNKLRKRIVAGQWGRESN